jgi:hypothetical protein
MRGFSITSSARASSVGGTSEAQRPGRHVVDNRLEPGRLQDRNMPHQQVTPGGNHIHQRADVVVRIIARRR